MEAKIMNLKRIDDGTSIYWELEMNAEKKEVYKQNAAIDFSVLIGFLKEDDLENKYAIKAAFNEPTTDEKRLISVLERIIENYNNSVDEYKNYVEEKQK